MKTNTGDRMIEMGDLNKIQFSDIFSLDEIQTLQNLFSDATGVASIITHPDGIPITKPSNFTRLCNDIIRKTEKGCANCFKSDAILGRHNTGGSVIQPCLSGGLWDAGASITIGGKHIANWLIGQVRNKELDEQNLLKYADEIGADKNLFREAMYEVPVMSVEQFSKVSKMLFAFANQLSEKAFNNIQLKMEIAEREKATKLLQESEGNYADIFQTVSDGIIHTTLSGQVISMNKSLEKILEVPEGDIVGKNILNLAEELLSSKHLKDISPILKRLIQGKDNRAFQVVYKNKILEITPTINQQTKRLTGLVRDITERKKVEDKLTENSSLIRQILDSIPQSVFWKDRNSVYLGCNKVFSNQIALSPSEVIGKSDFDLPWPKDEAEAYRADDKQVMDNNIPKVNIIEPLQTADGTRLFIDTTKIPLRDLNNNVYGVLGVFDDITEQVQAEAKLHETMIRQNAMISNIVDVIAIIDKDGINRYKSPNIEKWFGWKPEDLVGKLTWNNIHPDDLEKTQQIFSLLTTLPNNPKSGESRYLCKDGSYKWMEYTAVNLLHDPTVKGILLSYHEITERKNAEDLIQLEQQLKQKILESLPGIFYLYTYPQLNLVLWNKNHETLLGFESDEIKNRHIMDWHIPGAKEIVQKAVDLVMEKGMNILESPLMHKDGYYVPFLMTGVRFSTPNQEYLMGIGIDLTDRKRAEEALRESERILKESQKIAGLGNYRFNIKTGNWTSSEILDSIFGIDTNYLKTISGWMELIHPDWQEIMNNYLINEVIGNKTKFDFEYKVLRQNDKKEIWVHGLGVLEYDDNGNPIFMVGTIQDISHRKNTEMLLKEQREEIEIQNEEYLQLNEELIQLNEEMSQINDELLSAKERAEESDRLKTAFLQNLSHEIRTPMNAIMGFSSLLMENYGNKTKLEKFSEIISQRCNDLLEIINDILDIAKIESGQLPVNVEKCNLNELFEELTLFFEEHQKRIGKQHINFLLKSNLDLRDNLILTDKVKLKQIFINLIGNAFKFTNEGNIEGGCKFENDNLIFYVSDTGIGIPVEKHKVIFERFTQLYHNSNKAFGGTGLGLSIVKGLVELLGGEISIDSEPGKGTTFSFTFQYRKLHPSLHESFVKQEQSEYNFSGKTVLIVEDDFYNTEYLKEILTQFGINILYATNGKEAVQIALSQKPDLILMDIRLPDMDGYEATRQIKQQLPGLKIIAQTAYASHDEKQRAINLGCSDYISKPTKRELLMEMIGKHFLNV